MKGLTRYISAALAAAALNTVDVPNVNAGTEMGQVVERAEEKKLIQFNSIDEKNRAIQAAYGHFLPFDRVTVTKDGELIKLTDAVIDEIAELGYNTHDPAQLAEVAQNKEMLKNGDDFYIAVLNGSYKLITENKSLIGTTDENPRTPFTDLNVSMELGAKLREVAKARDDQKTEAYHLFNEIDSLTISVPGSEQEVIGILDDRFAREMKANSYRYVIGGLMNKLGIYSLLNDTFVAAGNTDENSETEIALRRREGGIDYAVKITNQNGALTTSDASLILEEKFWANQGIQKPTIEITAKFLGLEDVVASAIADSAIAAGSDSSTTEYTTIDSARATEETASVAITTTAPAGREEKTGETRKGLVVAAEYSNLSMYPTAILGARIGNFMPFAAYGLDRNSLNERVVMPTDSQGRHTEFDINTNGETKRFVAGLNYVHEFENKKSAEKLAVILGLHAGREFANSSGTSVPTRYSNELPVEVKPSTSLNGKNSSYVWGPNLGIQYGRFGVVGNADIGRKVNQFGVESTSKRIGAGLIYNLDGGKNE